MRMKADNGWDGHRWAVDHSSGAPPVRAPYSAKHIGGIPFDITRAHVQGRQGWYPRGLGRGPARETDGLREERDAGWVSPELAAYIVGVFQSPQLLGEGVEACWRLGTKSTQRISSAKWQVFQQQFMDGWAVWASNHNHNSFWRRHEPAFHAYDYGANIEIQEEEEEEEEGGEQGPRDGNVQQDIEELSLNDEQRTHSDAVDGREYQQMLRESRDLQR
ncbi:hypothetical protein CGCA056_v015057 [Colletotrichum aenigma]|uniref:uncharacterized protein n=1 Tax=Colletotrichum aenigma TaxID=1215731 RepID=UPI0018728FE5|nr:uncharacterized protein CGCA056_v015057 [Colletotrichum aenigma]KAF5486602.1 hypothetical protein CGCA056_v015057 [Colletotrichum aenigma]